MIKRFAALKKYDPEVWDSIQKLRQHADENPALTEHVNRVVRAMLTDTMVPMVGNKAAYNQHLQRHAHDGVHVHMDLNDFGEINKHHGHPMGDEAIMRFGTLLAGLGQKYRAKLFRKGGDEFAAWFEGPDEAHLFARDLRNVLGQHPKIGSADTLAVNEGVPEGYQGHNMAAAIGIGHNMDSAERSLIKAKLKLGPYSGGKRQNQHGLGESPTVIHSSFAGHPLDTPDTSPAPAKTDSGEMEISNTGKI